MWTGKYLGKEPNRRMSPGHLVPVVPREENLLSRRRKLAGKKEIMRTYIEMCRELTALLQER